MADIIAIARGRGTNSETECSRLASREAEVQVNTWRTFVNVVMQKDGSTRITVSRSHLGTGPLVLTEIWINSERSESPLMTCDGMLRETMFLIAREEMMDSDIASSFGRTVTADIEEDR